MEKTPMSREDLMDLPQTDRLTLANESLEAWHAGNNDWARVLADKWQLARLEQGGRL